MMPFARGLPAQVVYASESQAGLHNDHQEALVFLGMKRWAHA